MTRTPREAPRILIVTPEIASLPAGMGKGAETVAAKAGGMADISAGLISALFELGADVHLALPNYRRLFNVEIQKLVNSALREYKSTLEESQIHLAEDRAFYYRDSVYGTEAKHDPRFSMIFQREVINNIIPRVDPDLIHCHDWMTGLIPAVARRLEIPCLQTVHNIHTYELTLEEIEDSGIDAREFWRYLYYSRFPQSYEESRSANKVDFLASGIFGAHFVNTVSQTFLDEIVRGVHDFVPYNVQCEMRHKVEAGCAVGILNAPPNDFNPTKDELIEKRYSAASHEPAKRANKKALQKALDLEVNEAAPLFFWPSRLDPYQKGPELLARILHDVVTSYRRDGLQVALVGDGPFQSDFHDLIEVHGLSGRVGITQFDERLSHLGYAGADFVLMPSRFEPCGLPQMVGALYGALPVVRDTGGLHDTVKHLIVSENAGNGFVFETYDSDGLRWAIDRAMEFYRLPPKVRAGQIARVMGEALRDFNFAVPARQYFDLYERMLKRPLC
jgi:starch synthase